MVLLDTNLVSELRKVRFGKADAGVAAWADQVEPVRCSSPRSLFKHWSWGCC